MAIERLQSFGPEIWTCEGPVVDFYGFPYPTRMAIIRLADGSLFVWSPVALDDDLKAEVDALGHVAHLVSPNKIHHLFLGIWRDAYPTAVMHAGPGLSRRRPDLAFTGELGDEPVAAWAEDIDQVHFSGSFVMTEIVFLHRKSRTAIFADLIENFPPDWFKGWRAVLARLDGIVSPNYGAPREWRATFWRRRNARAALGKILAFAPERVVIAHGEMAHSEGERFIRNAFRWLGD